jgi:hypothetical protein
MVAGQMTQNIVRTGLALLDVLVDVIEDEQPADVVRSCKLGQHMRYYDIEIVIPNQHGVPAPLGNLAFQFFACADSKTLP